MGALLGFIGGFITGQIFLICVASYWCRQRR